MTRISLTIPSTLAATFALVGCAGGARSTTAAGSVALHATSATDRRVRVMGRHLVRGDTVAFGASGVTFFVKFRGPTIQADLDVLVEDTTAHEWFTVVADGRSPVRFRADARTHRYTLARGLSDDVHTLALSKATEGQNGHERLVDFRAREILQADPLPERRIEFIGNSITACFGVDPQPIPCGRGTWYDATHAWLAYGPRVARTLRAQWMLSAVSGIGIVRNWNSPGPVMSRVYAGVYMDYADSVPVWDFHRYTPDLVVIALGTNDFSDGAGPTPRPPLDGDAFVRDYTAFVAGVRARYPRTRILLVDSPMLEPMRKQRQSEYLQRVVAARTAAGDDAISQFSFTGHFTHGCDGHPDMAEQSAMAQQLLPEVQRVMHW
jgi:Carbohydrate esterase 2 N-terminal/GDSL-like Lipase/Acylhydrolase family